MPTNHADFHLPGVPRNDGPPRVTGALAVERPFCVSGELPFCSSGEAPVNSASGCSRDASRDAPRDASYLSWRAAGGGCVPISSVKGSGCLRLSFRRVWPVRLAADQHGVQHVEAAAGQTQGRLAVVLAFLAFAVVVGA